MRNTGAPEATPVSRLWLAFVLGWVVMLVVVAGMLVQAKYPAAMLAVALPAIAVLGILYLGVTLHRPIEPADLAPSGPEPGALRRRLAVLGGMASVVVLLVLLLPTAGAWWLAMHVIVAAGLVLPAPLAGWIVAATIGLTIGSAWLISGHPDPMLLILIAFGAAAMAIRRLTLTVAELQAAREALAEAAVDRERLRFARDLHDLLGHTLSLISLKSELARRLLPDSAARAAVEIADVERAARDALHQARAAAAGYRRPALRQELAAARELLSAAGIAVRVDEASGPVEPEIDALIAWAVREGVTNVIRHSRAEHCDIRIRRQGELVELAVADDGAGAGAGASLPGHGLAGLAERAASHRGEIRAGPQPGGGFRLLLSVPAARTVSA